MCLYYLARYCQTQASAAAARSHIVGLCTRAIGFIKTLEDAHQLFLTNPHARITHEEALQILTQLGRGPHDDCPPGGGKFDGVMHKVEKYARDQFAIGNNLRASLLNFGAQTDTMTLSQR